MNNWLLGDMNLFYLQHPNAVLLKGFHTCCEALLPFLRGSVSGKNLCKRQLIASPLGLVCSSRWCQLLCICFVLLLCYTEAAYLNHAVYHFIILGRVEPLLDADFQSLLNLHLLFQHNHRPCSYERLLFCEITQTEQCQQFGINVLLNKTITL